jgi:hypothetical protein
MRRKLSWLIREFEIDSPLAPNDAIVALLRWVGRPRRINLIPFRKPKHEYEGDISPEGFRITRVSGQGTVLLGSLSTTETGTHVSILVGPAIGLVVFLGISALIYFVVMLGGLVTSAPNGRSDWFIFFGIIGALLITFIFLAFAAAHLAARRRKETRRVLPILEEIFQAHAIAKQRDQSSREMRARKAFGDSVREEARRFRVPLLWFAEAVGIVAIVVGIGFVIMFLWPPKTSVMGPGQVDWRFFSVGVNLFIAGVFIALDVIEYLRFPPN